MEKKKGFMLIIGIYTIIQLIILLGFGYTPYPDSQGYITCAQNALAYNQFYPAKETLYTLPFLWNIGAINTVAFSLKLFHSVTPVLIIYILLKGGTLNLVYLITHKWFGEKMQISLAWFTYSTLPIMVKEQVFWVKFLLYFLLGRNLCKYKRKLSDGRSAHGMCRLFPPNSYHIHSCTHTLPDKEL